jgi:hypothetical protein
LRELTQPTGKAERSPLCTTYFLLSVVKNRRKVPVHCDHEDKENHLLEASRSAQLTQAHEKPKEVIPQHLVIDQFDDSLSKLRSSPDLRELQSERTQAKNEVTK